MSKKDDERKKLPAEKAADAKTPHSYEGLPLGTPSPRDAASTKDDADAPENDQNI